MLSFILNRFKKKKKQEVWKNEHYAMCKEVWYKPQVNWDGKLLGCCINAYKDFGVNVFDTGLENALSTELYDYTKKMLQGKVPPREDSPCFNCPFYKEMVAKNDFISDDEIEELFD